MPDKPEGPNEAPKKEKEMISGTFTVQELIGLVKTMNESNRAEMREFARELATSLQHPEPTDKERALIQQQVKLRIERARERSEEHTSELQSRLHLVCRLLLEKK